MNAVSTDQGKAVPFIVRQETGTIDRDEYRIAVLFDPAKPFSAVAPQDAFNHKLVIFHGASCDTEYQQPVERYALRVTAVRYEGLLYQHRRSTLITRSNVHSVASWQEVKEDCCWQARAT